MGHFVVHLSFQGCTEQTSYKKQVIGSYFTAGHFRAQNRHLLEGACFLHPEEFWLMNVSFNKGQVPQMFDVFLLLDLSYILEVCSSSHWDVNPNPFKPKTESNINHLCNTGWKESLITWQRGFPTMTLLNWWHGFHPNMTASNQWKTKHEVIPTDCPWTYCWWLKSCTGWYGKHFPWFAGVQTC